MARIANSNHSFSPPIKTSHPILLLATTLKLHKLITPINSNHSSIMVANALLSVIIFLYATSLKSCVTATDAVIPTAYYNASDLSSCFLSAEVGNFTIASFPPAEASASSYYELLNVSIRNLRFTGPTVPKPVAIILPQTKQQLQSTVTCCRRAAVALRIRSGGHSYEGLSYVGEPGKPFVIIDVMKMNNVTVDLTSATAWVESGATLGEIYHAIAESSSTLGFPAGSCATVGSGGHIGGGGFGLLSRRYGLAADNVIDAVLIDPAGRALDRRSMGEDVFWAIRGGGGGSWGAVYAWRVKLVPVPENVTVFSISRPGTKQQVAGLIHKWQHVSPGLPDEFYLSTSVSVRQNGSSWASFIGLFLGRRPAAMAIVTHRFPELRLMDSDCVEMSWIESVVSFAGVGSVAELRNRVAPARNYFKAKSDYVQDPITMDGLIGALDWLGQQTKGYVILDPYGGAMGRIPSDHTPFPHRGGNLYGIQYVVVWNAEDDYERKSYMEWLRGFYGYMEPMVSKNPRAAYVNYLDLDLGMGSTVETARVWGEKYFMKNFDRLVRAKTIIDSNNVFNNAQSIPPLPRHGVP